MKSNIWYDTFLEILQKKYPNKAQLTQMLMELLDIERESVYRRLRKSVVFPAHEILKIASAWNISLDEIINVNSGQVSFQLRRTNYLNPSESELVFLRSIIKTLYYLENYPETETIHICNRLPREITAGYPSVNQYYLFKWMYEYGMEKTTLPYSKIKQSKEMVSVAKEFAQAVKLVSNVTIILDSHIFNYLIDDIQYFHSILLITDEEKKLIKKELLQLLDYMRELADRGVFPETGKKVSMFISHLNIETNYCYTSSPEMNACFIHTFEKYELHSFNSEMVANFKKWMLLKKKTSIQISEVDERNRIDFFSRQKQLVEGL